MVEGWRIQLVRAFGEFDDLSRWYSTPLDDRFFSFPGPVAYLEEMREFIERLKVLHSWPAPRDPGSPQIAGDPLIDLIDSPDMQLRVSGGPGQSIAIWIRSPARLHPSWLQGDARESELRGQIATVGHEDEEEPGKASRFEHLRLKCAEGLTFRQLAERTGESVVTVVDRVAEALNALRQRLQYDAGEWQFTLACRFSHAARIDAHPSGTGLGLTIADADTPPAEVVIPCSPSAGESLKGALAVIAAPPYEVPANQSLDHALHRRVIVVEGEATRKHGGSWIFQYSTMLLGMCIFPEALFRNPQYDASMRVRIRGLFLCRPEGGYQRWRTTFQSQLIAYEMQPIGEAGYG